MLEMLKKTAVGQSLLNWLINYKIKKRESRQLTSADVNDLRRQFGQDTKGFDRYLHDNVRCRVVIAPDFVRIVKKLQTDFGLRNFVETGTYDGETSLAMSLLFEKVFTCDVIDWKRRPEIYFADNLTYETKTSPDFLRAHLPEIRKQSIFFLDAHWGAFWPLRDELSIIFSQCENPLIVIDVRELEYLESATELGHSLSTILNNIVNEGVYMHPVNWYLSKNIGLKWPESLKTPLDQAVEELILKYKQDFR